LALPFQLLAKVEPGPCKRTWCAPTTRTSKVEKAAPLVVLLFTLAQVLLENVLPDAPAATLIFELAFV